jgi:transposase
MDGPGWCILVSMATQLNITTERVDDIPIVFEVARQLRLPEIVDEVLGRHGNHEGLSYGWLATGWLAYILVEGDHRKSVVEEWAQGRRLLLRKMTGQRIRDVEFNDDRLGRLLGRLADPEQWQEIESAVWGRSALVYELACEQVRMDSTTSYGYHTVTEDGLMQFGHSKDHRPDKPQLKLMAAVAEPAGQMVASDVHPGYRADDGLYEPLVGRVREIVGSGKLYIGDAKMAALGTREAIVAGGDDYLTRLPKRGTHGERDSWVDQALQSEDSLVTIGEGDETFGRGYEFTREVEGSQTIWTERVVVYQSERRRLKICSRSLHPLDRASGRSARQSSCRWPSSTSRSGTEWLACWRSVGSTSRGHRGGIPTVSALSSPTWSSEPSRLKPPAAGWAGRC